MYQHEVEVEQNEDHYRMVSWQSFKSRINAPKNESDFKKQLRLIVKHSFFPLLHKTVIVEDWIKEIYQWELYHRGLSTKYCAEFSLDHWTSQEKTESKYWNEYKKIFKVKLKEISDELKFGSQWGAIDETAHIYGLFDRWKHSHISGYFRCRLMEMSTMKLLADMGSPIDCTKLNTATVNDLLSFCRVLQTIDKTCSLPRTTYHDFMKLCQHALNGKIPSLIECFVKKSTPEKRRLIYEDVLLRRVIDDIEHRVTNDASTVYPVYVKTLLYYFHQLFDIEMNNERTSYDLDDSDDDCEILQFFIDNLKWSRANIDRNNLKKNSLLFIVIPQSDANKKEEAICRILYKNIQCDVTVESSEWNINEWQESFQNLDSIDKALYDIRLTFVQYRLIDFKRMLDIEHASKVLGLNFYETMIIRPLCSQYTVDKCRRYCSMDLAPCNYNEFSDNCFDVKDALGRNYARPLIVVLDCHLFSYDDMLQLVEWFHTKKSTIQRVVMMSVSDTLPLHTRGQTFIDLIQWKEPAYIQSNIFDSDSFNKETDLLITQFNESLSFLYQYNHVKEFILSHNKKTLYFILSPKQYKHDQQYMIDSLRGNMNIKFISANTITFHCVRLQELHSLVRTKNDCFFMTMDYLKELTRNEINHLLLEIDSLVIITNDEIYTNEKKLKWFKKIIKEQTYPNLRYTMPFVQKTIGLTAWTG
jgi:hypothetical protein